MKKRTKKKIHNRIIKKLISGQTLSGFDKKYHESMVRKVYISTSNDAWRAKVMPEPVHEHEFLLAELEEEPGRWQKIPAPRLENRAVRSNPPMFIVSINEQTQSAADAISNFGKAGETIERLSDHCSNQTITKPSKWERVKSKVKGWLHK